MKEAKPNIILKYASITVLFMLVLMGTSFLMLSLFMPRVVADFSYSLGMQNVALYYYERTYHQTEELDDLYNAVSVSVMVKNNQTTIALFEEMLSKDGYTALMQEIDAETAESNLSVVTKSTLLNEDNYLKNQYVLALLLENQMQRAITFATQQFPNQLLTLNSLGVYALTNILTESNANNPLVISMATQTLLGDPFMVVMNDYFVSLCELFDVQYDNLENLTALQKSQMLYLARRISTVAGNLNVANQLATPILNDEEIALYVIEISERLADLV